MRHALIIVLILLYYFTMLSSVLLWDQQCYQRLLNFSIDFMQYRLYHSHRCVWVGWGLYTSFHRTEMPKHLEPKVWVIQNTGRPFVPRTTKQVYVLLKSRTGHISTEEQFMLEDMCNDKKMDYRLLESNKICDIDPYICYYVRVPSILRDFFQLKNS